MIGSLTCCLSPHDTSCNTCTIVGCGRKLQTPQIWCTEKYFPSRSRIKQRFVKPFGKDLNVTDFYMYVKVQQSSYNINAHSPLWHISIYVLLTAITVGKKSPLLLILYLFRVFKNCFYQSRSPLVCCLSEDGFNLFP